LPINLPTALQLGNVQSVAVMATSERIRVAAATLDQANVLWLPSVTFGGDYNRHDGFNQDAAGNVFAVQRQSWMFGFGSGMLNAAVINVNDAIFAPLAARQQVRARQADLQVASNDTMVAVSDAYFTVQQARGELAGALAAKARTEELIRRTRKLAPALVPELETVRAEAELARREQAELLAKERGKVASAQLLRIIRLDPCTQVEPAEPPHLRVDLVDLHRPLDELIPIGLKNRPELSSQQALVQATLTLLKQERLRPLVPSVLLRGFSTPVTGTLATGIFGGSNNAGSNAGIRADVDLQILWQLDNLGFGNVGKIRQRNAENRAAVVELFRIQDLVAAEVAQAHAQAQTAAQRVEAAERGVRLSVESVDKNMTALSQTKGVGNQLITLIRPQEVVAAIQALAQAYVDYYGAVADANRAQFRLYRALGQPAQHLIQDQHDPCSPSLPAESTSAPHPEETIPAPNALPDAPDKPSESTSSQ
jgi:outer membrane protein TolC